MDPASASTRVIRSLAGKADDVIRAYHGSPYSFDRFDASKIGTGEGAQAYGHGLYFAGAEPVADMYRTSVSALRRTPHEDAMEFWRRHAEISGNKQKAVLDALDHAEGSLDEAAGMPEAEQRWKDIIQHLYELDFRQPLPKRPGHMYEVEIGYPEEALLDYDRKLTEQPGPVLDYARSLGYRGDMWKGEDLYGDLGRFTPEDIRPGWTSVLNTINDRVTRPKVAAARLMEAGIPGIRYLDQGSRSAGEGTRNYVIFPGAEDRIRILRQYGLLAPIALQPGEE